MIEFGKTLRTAREAKGLTTAQVAESTHMMIQIVEGLENEDFSRIVAPIYGRGFVKLYCEAVGLDPKDLIAEFMEIYNGNRPATIRVREVPPAAPQENVAPVATQPTPTQQMTVPPAQPERATREEPSLPHSGESSLFSTPSAPAKSDFAAADPLLDFPSTDEEPKKPIKRTFHRPEMSMPELPPSLWRMAVVIGVLLVVLWFLFVGIRALYRATMLPPPAETTTSETVQPAKQETVKPTAKDETKTTARESQKKTERTPMPIPSLYID